MDRSPPPVIIPAPTGLLCNVTTIILTRERRGREAREGIGSVHRDGLARGVRVTQRAQAGHAHLPGPIRHRYFVVAVGVGGSRKDLARIGGNNLHIVHVAVVRIEAREVQEGDCGQLDVAVNGIVSAVQCKPGPAVASGKE